jgi:CRISPR/Cas system-associated protein Cas5 (RAMP superfamily)
MFAFACGFGVFVFTHDYILKGVVLDKVHEPHSERIEKPETSVDIR